MIRVIASIELRPGKRHEFLRNLAALLPQVHAEKGCREYLPMVDLETTIAAQGPVRPDHVTVVEAWEDLAGLEAHLVAPHMRDYRKAVAGLVERVSLQILQEA